MKTSLAHKLAEEFINVLKYNPELKHEEKILALELRLEKLISDVEKGCEEAHKRLEKQPQAESSGGTILFFGRNMGDGPAIVSEEPNEREMALGNLLKSRGPAN